jgi:CBS domain containing-hemolysin-like protein
MVSAMNDGSFALLLDIFGVVALLATLGGLIVVCVAGELAILRVRTARLALLDSGHDDTSASTEAGRRLHVLLLLTRAGETSAVMAMGLILVPLLGGMLAGPFGGASNEPAGAIGFTVAFLGLALLAVLVGQQVSRALVAAHPVGTLRALEPALRRAAVIARPLTFVIERAERALVGLLGLQPAYTREGAHSEADLQVLISTSEARGVLDPVEQDLAAASLEFGALAVSDIMVPRVDVSALSDERTLAQARAFALASGHDWYPVYHGSTDNIVGVLEWRGLFGSDAPDWPTRALPAFFLPETLPASMALAKMRADKAEMAIALDEHGGTAGIVTSRTLFEELTRTGASFEAGMEISGRTPLRVTETLLATELGDESQIATIGGLVTAALGRLAVLGDTAIIANWRFEVTRIARSAIAMVRITPRSGADDLIAEADAAPTEETAMAPALAEETAMAPALAEETAMAPALAEETAMAPGSAEETATTLIEPRL